MLNGQGCILSWLGKLTALCRYPYWAWWTLSCGEVKGWIRKWRRQREVRQGKRDDSEEGCRLSRKRTSWVPAEIRLSLGLLSGYLPDLCCNFWQSWVDLKRHFWCTVTSMQCRSQVNIIPYFLQQKPPACIRIMPSDPRLLLESRLVFELSLIHISEPTRPY